MRRTFVVDKPAAMVLAYLADFANTVHWDPGTQECSRVGAAGPVTVGSKWHNVSKVLGRETTLEYTLEELAADRAVLVGRNDTATSTDRITVTEHPDGSQVVYDSTIDLHGLAKIAAPVMKIEFERLGDRTVEGITAAIAAL